MKNLFSIFLLLSVALSSVGMSVSQHLCSMSKEEIEASMCDMCSKEDHGDQQTDEKSCCSNESVHLRLDSDATSTKTQHTPQPIISDRPFELVLEALASRSSHLGQVRGKLLPTFPLSEEHCVLRV